MNYQRAHIDSQSISTLSKVFRETLKSNNIRDLTIFERHGHPLLLFGFYFALQRAVLKSLFTCFV